MILNVYIKNNLGPFSFDPDDQTPVLNRLTDYFNRIVAGTTWGCRVTIVSTLPAAVADTDLVCYLAEGRLSSTLTNLDHTEVPSRPGWTRRNSAGTVASEVFFGAIPSSERQTLLPNLIFHELMHNKSGMDNELHRLGGGGLASERIFSVTPLTPENIEFMRSRLDNVRHQWTLG